MISPRNLGRMLKIPFSLLSSIDLAGWAMLTKGLAGASVLYGESLQRFDGVSEQ